MKELTLPPELSCEIREIYDSMVAAYDEVAGAVTLTCDGCPDNCCDSYFLHYTYSEWAYLWMGLRALGDEQLDRILGRARDCVAQSRMQISRGERPTIMCPLNEAGRCTLYVHRLMICRTHGVPATLTRPDHQLLRFPGCFRARRSSASGSPWKPTPRPWTAPSSTGGWPSWRRGSWATGATSTRKSK